MEKEIGIVGAGSWGIALAYLLRNNGHKVTVWSRRQETVDKLKAYHGNEDKLPGVILDDSVVFTCNMEEAVRNKDLIVLVVPSAHMRETVKLMAPFVDGNDEHQQIIVNCSKGIEEQSLMVMSDVILDEIPGCQVCVMSGPSHAEEVGKGMPTSIVVGAFDKETARLVQNVFMSNVFRVYISPDMLGIEIGAALKNVIALAAGIADGYGLGDNAKAALITRGIAEIGRLGMAMGGKFETFSGLSGIGDLIVTCASMHSRNRRAGILIGQGKSMQEAMDEVKMVVEGVYSAKAARLLAEKYEVEMPIVTAVNQVLFEGKSPAEALNDLMIRDKKIESSNLDW
ncbi:NAD(P)H-dependent glycerol-3-phosphate dehydrogenase GpsA [Butyrivibrio proteoclasticus B316]|uniref:Glycerol-3-phosphate dehydrogenase [NAD(P)+] n=1 Tax=Butyrivibrio proteoclasticus (strain ATCC 51982 / DSM 14932 / B316) TaxID=515622 RepID=E0RV07_BUTPB|nr:NAD(P)H-dependent glycerol-3-phosphate dehydrogenase [Butyrivibrio proteoclasticus]ADL34277.1 NAD(P)H-dependent glycerol-3-phosphate dehydrogenase GpsA [Butyrivibrio proteoclasticus B316]